MAVTKLHEQIMEQGSVTFNDLPVNIQKKIKGFNLLNARYEKDESDEKLRATLERQTLAIGEMVQEFIDNGGKKDEPDPKPEPKGDDPKPDPKPQPKPEPKGDDPKPEPKGDDPKPDPKPQPAPQPTPNPKGFGNLVMETKILKKIKENGGREISKSDLADIIKQDPDYPEQQVHNIRLRKVFLSSYYRLV
jgi:outer membrane biosynthesis protein TonB